MSKAEIQMEDDNAEAAWPSPFGPYGPDPLTVPRVIHDFEFEATEEEIQEVIEALEAARKSVSEFIARAI